MIFTLTFVAFILCFMTRYAATTEADLDQPITQLTTTRPPLLTAESMKEVVVGKYLWVCIKFKNEKEFYDYLYREMFDSGRSSTWNP